MKSEIHIPLYHREQIFAATTPQLPTWVEISGLPKSTVRWFLAARNEALKSNFHKSKIGCVIVYKNRIIGRGHNQVKTHPVQKEYDQKYRVWVNCDEYGDVMWHTLHAEIDAITNIPDSVLYNISISKAEVFLFRVAPGLELCTGLVLPCPACAHALSDLGIRKAYYTTGHVDKPLGVCDL